MRDPGVQSRRALVFLAVVASAACQPSVASERDDPPREPPERLTLKSAPTVRYHMRGHLGDLRAIERMLVHGHLADAKALAFMLTKREADPGMAPLAADARQAVEIARGLAAARSIDEALRYEARVAETCAECHLHAQKLPVFPPPAVVPPELPTPAARMARHQWAADRLWEGLVGAEDDRWRIGLDVLSRTPPPFSPLTDAPALADNLQERARKALAARATETLEERATTYGEILVTCAACHTTLGKAAAR
jgi:cytochrome c553